MKTKNVVNDLYVGLEAHEQVYLRPTTYVGNIFNTNQNVFISETVNDKIQIYKKNILFNAAYIKIFDEVITNASDQFIKKGLVKNIIVNINDDCISIENDGSGIPVQIHDKFQMYAPELIFSRLFTSESYDEDCDRITGGMNGMGVKLTNIFSKKFIVETADGSNKFYQEYYNNLKDRSKPKITKSSKNYVKVTYYPDFEKFDINNTEDIKKVLYRRCCDISAYCGKVKVYFNDNLIDIKTFKNYVDCHLENNSEVLYDKLENFEIALTSNRNLKKLTINNDEILENVEDLDDVENVLVLDDEIETENVNNNIIKEDLVFEQVSIVNGINTYVGGTHVDYISNYIVEEIKKYLQKTNKKLHIKNTDIKNNLCLFLTCIINKPVFDTQSKEKLSSKMEKVILSDSFIKKILKSQLVADILEDLLNKNNVSLSKNLSSSKAKNVRIKKLEDANFAGTKNSHLTYLVLTEGDSAKGLITNSLTKDMRNTFGVYSLKGKILNVKKASNTIINNNAEIKDINKILGLQHGKKYTDKKDLRYDKVIMATDADCDGLHIKGLLINYFETFYPELLHLDFLYEFVAPILRVGKANAKDVKYIYTLNEYNKIKNIKNDDLDITYFKGLGTITPVEGKMFFSNIKKHILKFNMVDEKISRDMIKMIFTDDKNTDNVKASDIRKDWLLTYKPKEVVDKFDTGQSYEKFFNEEYIEFSMDNNLRSIPSVFDGLKPSQRKVLYTLFKLNLKKDVKVSELYGSINTIANYHHGNAAMEQCIIGMAQKFVGSNNINYLIPSGIFGSRLKGGKDSSAPRYLFTNLNDISNDIFIKDDSELLPKTFEEGKFIEPLHYIPIIPTLLVNGCSAIGTGWSTDIPPYNPMELIVYIENKLNNKKNNIELHPYYNGFKGEIVYDENNKSYITKAIYKYDKNILHITELPIGMWVDKYAEILDNLLDDKVVKNFNKNCTDEFIDITIQINPDEYEKIKDKFVSVFKLETNISMNNMYAFDGDFKIKKYNSVYEIIEDYFVVRWNYYQKRKDYLISKLEYELKIVVNKIKFLAAVVKNEISITKKSKAEIIKILEDISLIKINDSYDYILDMNLWSLSKEKLEELKEKYNKIKNDIQATNDVDLKTMWLNDLDVLKKKYKKLYK